MYVTTLYTVYTDRQLLLTGCSLLILLSTSLNSDKLYLLRFSSVAEVTIDMIFSVEITISRDFQLFQIHEDVSVNYVI